MREIKIRAWDGEQYWYGVVPLFKTMEIVLNNPLAGNKLHKVKCFEEWTGLTDKTGKDIYEGDIVAVGESFPHHKIVWNIYECNFMLKNEDGMSVINKTDMNNVFIVVGNIYENKELMKK